MQRIWGQAYRYWTNLKRATKNQRKKPRGSSCKSRGLRCEPLEERQLLSISPVLLEGAAGTFTPPSAEMTYGPILSATSPSCQTPFQPILMPIAAGSSGDAADGSEPLPFTTNYNLPGILQESPDTFDFWFLAEIDPASVQAGDLTINGVGVTEVEVFSNSTESTVKFTIPELDEGVYEITLAEGAISSTDGRTNNLYSEQLTIDSTSPVLLETSIIDGAQLTTGLITVEATFSEPLKESKLELNTILIEGEDFGRAYAESIGFDAETCKLTLTFEAPIEDFWTVTFPIPGQHDGLRDLGLNPLAEETSIWFTTEDDLGGTVLDGEFERIGPLGTGALAWDVADTINHAVDRDSFVVTGESGLFLNGPFGVPGELQATVMQDYPTTLVLSPADTLQATLEVRDASGTLLASGRADQPGEVISVTMPGMLGGELPYTITVGSTFGTSGEYLLQNLAWSTVEEEYIGGESNDTEGTAEVLDDRFLAVGVGNANRTVVVGTAAEGDDDWYRFSVGAVGTTLSVALDADGATPGLTLYSVMGATDPLEGVWSDDGTLVINQIGSQITLPVVAEYLVRVAGGSGEYTLAISRNATLDTESNNLETPQPIGVDNVALGWLETGTTVTQQLFTDLPDQAGNLVDNDVVIDGNRAVVSLIYSDAPCYVGVYEYDGQSWSETARLARPDEVAQSQAFGSNLAIQGDMIIVGAREADVAAWDAGIAYVYESIDGEWQMTQRLLPDDLGERSSFGRDIKLAGDTLVIGAWLDSSNGSRSGSVYVYERNDGLWELTQKIIPTELSFRASCYRDSFGYSIDVDGDLMAIGSPMADSPNLVYDTGLVTIYQKIEGTWVEQTTITNPEPIAFHCLGTSVTLHDGVLLASAPGHIWDELPRGGGAVYVFEFDGTNWEYAQKLVGANIDTNDMFGWRAIDSDGTQLVAGSKYNDFQADDSGIVYVFTAGEEGWEETAELTINGANGSEYLGKSVAIDGQHLLATVGGLHGLVAFDLEVPVTDTYSMEASAFDMVEVSFERPGLGLQELYEMGGVTIEVYAPDGTLIESSTDPEATFFAATTGTYTISITATSAEAVGEYVLSTSKIFTLPEDGVLEVSTLDDGIDDDYSPGNLSLREAVQITELYEWIDTITFDPMLLTDPTTQTDSDATGGFAGTTLELTDGELVITSPLTIRGPGANLLAIDANYDSRIFNLSLDAEEAVAISGLTLTEGQSGRGGAIFSKGGILTIKSSVFENNSVVNNGSGTDGGAMRTESTLLTLLDTQFIGNISADDGGAIETDSEIHIIGCTFENNQANDNGGALAVHGGTVEIADSQFINNLGEKGGAFTIRVAAEVTVTGSLFQNNQAHRGTEGDGGAIAVLEGSVTINGSSLIDNYSLDDGGAIFGYSGNCTVNIYNSTISGNVSDSSSGAIHGDGNTHITLVNSTIAYNVSDHNYTLRSSSPMLVVNTIIANNTLIDGTPIGPDGTFADGSTNNLVDTIGTATGLDPTMNLIGIDPLLLPLADNGGGLPTHALEAFSPAINVGSNSDALGPDGLPLEFDQRGDGYARIVDSTVDIGAFEHQDPIELPVIPGDANGDGFVDGSDVTIVSCNWQNSGLYVSWYHGDFNGDHIVDGSDVTILANNWNKRLDPENQFTVTTLEDVIDPWDGVISLRESLAAADENEDENTITFAPMLFFGETPGDLVPRTLTLDGTELKIYSDVTIQGPGVEMLTISGNQTSRVFYLCEGTAATIADLTIANGQSDTDLNTAADTSEEGLAIASQGSYLYETAGGGILGIQAERLNLIRTAFTNNQSDVGGAVYLSHGILNIVDSEFYDNTAMAVGGAIRTDYANLTLTGSTIADNQAPNAGSAMSVFHGSAAITNSTIVQNSSLRGSALEFEVTGTVTIVNSTIAYNMNDVSNAAAGIASNNYNTVLYNTIVAENYGLADFPYDLQGTFSFNSSNNLIGGLGSSSGIDPEKNLTGLLIHLEPLTYNGGPTRTRALPADSPAIDAGKDALALGPDRQPLEFDQRGDGYERIAGSAVDIGAFELQDLAEILTDAAFASDENFSEEE